jgi:hypothetical protein
MPKGVFVRKPRVPKVKEAVNDPLIQEASDKVVGLTEEALEKFKEVVAEEKTASETAKINPPNPVIYKIICGVCHTAHVGRIVKDRLENQKGSFQVFDSKVKMDDIPLIQVLCKRCGCISWKISPEVEDQKILRAYGNMALKRG